MNYSSLSKYDKINNKSEEKLINLKENEKEINKYEAKNAIQHIFRNQFKKYMKNDINYKLKNYNGVNEKNIQLYKELFIDNPIQFCVLSLDIN